MKNESEEPNVAAQLAQKRWDKADERSRQAIAMREYWSNLSPAAKRKRLKHLTQLAKQRKGKPRGTKNGRGTQTD